jgi:hypothetical protein
MAELVFVAELLTAVSQDKEPSSSFAHELD